MPAHTTTTATTPNLQANEGVPRPGAVRRMPIDGRQVAAERGQAFPSPNPGNGKVVGYAAARRAFDTTTWSTEVAFRISCLDQLRNALLEQFDVTAAHAGPAPGFAEQTDQILEELGLEWDKIIELKAAGAVT